MENNKIKPIHLKDFIIHASIAKHLNNFDIGNLTNIILHGPVGAGKSTLLYALIRHLFKTTEINKFHKHLQLPSAEITYMDGEHFLELSPSDYGLQDRIVVTEFIKQMASTKSVKSFLSKGNIPKYKILVMNSIELMTEASMAALRRTIEQHARNIRLIMLTNDITKIMKPIRSRAHCIFIPAPTDIEIANLLTKIEEEQVINLDTQIFNKIIENGEGNLHKILYFFEAQMSSLQETIKNGSSKKLKVNEIEIKMDYEKELDNICNKIMQLRTPQTVLNCRKVFYSLLSNQILSNTILDRMTYNFLKENVLKNVRERDILNLFSIYKKRLENTNKEIIHLEAFVLGIMCLFDN